MRRLMLGMVIVVAACSSSESGDARTAERFKERACEDFSELATGITDGTMSVPDVIDKLSKMHENTRKATLYDATYASWDAGVLRLQADYENGALGQVEGHIDGAAGPC